MPQSERAENKICSKICHVLVFIQKFYKLYQKPNGVNQTIHAQQKTCFLQLEELFVEVSWIQRFLRLLL